VAGSSQAPMSVGASPISYAAGATLTAKVEYDIEEHWDYAFIEVSSDNGQTWTALEVPGHSDDPANDQSGFNQQDGGICNRIAAVS
jgi:hypothetical protein